MARVTGNVNDLSGIRIGDAFVVIIRTEWNPEVNDRLQEGCVKVFDSANVKYQIIKVPGAFELPFTVQKYWLSTEKKSRRPDAFVTLGCVLRGDTPHFDYVCKAVTEGVLELNLRLPVPVIFGVLTVDNQAQADERTGGVHGHKGSEAATTALKMITLCRSMDKSKSSKSAARRKSN